MSDFKNEDVLINFVKANAPEKLSKEWVIWAFTMLRDAKGRINPEWLSCSVRLSSVDHEPHW